MSQASADLAAYEAAKARLVEWARSARASHYAAHKRRKSGLPGPGPAATREELRTVQKQLHELAPKLQALADRMTDGPAWSALEDGFDRSGAPGGVRSLAAGMRALAFEMVDAFSAVATTIKGLPDPREKPFQHYAATVFLHLRWRYRQALPTTYEDHPVVVEFAAITEVGRSRARTLLDKANTAFDPYMPPEGLDDFL